MDRRQTTPKQWLIVNQELDGPLSKILHGLPRGSGIMIIQELSSPERRRLKLLGKLRSLAIIVERRDNAVRVHNIRELTRALIGRPSLILLSPIYETRSHPDWKRMPRMRAAALARLCAGKAVALGGMDEKRYAKLAALGFIGWAGISAFRI